MDLDYSPPYFLYQSVNLNVDMVEETIKGSTTLWVAYKKGVAAGAQLNLHCRQCQIQEVTFSFSFFFLPSLFSSPLFLLFSLCHLYFSIHLSIFASLSLLSNLPPCLLASFTCLSNLSRCCQVDQRANRSAPTQSLYRATRIRSIDGT